MPPAELKDQLHGHIQVFLNEKSFEGCAGLQLDDEIRVTIAAQACMLLMPEKLRRKHPDLYGELMKFYAIDPASWRES